MKIYQKTYTLSNLSPTVTLDILAGEQLYYIRGTGTLSTGWSIGASDVPTRPTSFKIWYNGAATYSGGNTVTVLNRVLTQEQALNGKCIIEANYNFITASWDVAVLEGFDTDYEGLNIINMNLAGETITLTSNSKQVQYMTAGGATLNGNYNVTYSGTFRDGQTFFIKYAAPLTIGAFSITIFGVTINSGQALGGNCTVIAWYDLANTTFRTQLIVSPPSSSAFNYTTLPVSVSGVLYPAATAGDAFRIVCAGEEGRLGTNLAVLPYQEPPNVVRVYNNDILYCETTNSGGTQGAVGSYFSVWTSPRPMVPISTTNGDSNFRVNIPGNPSTPNTVGGGTNTGNGFWGRSNSVNSGSVLNWIVGIGNSIIGGLYNLVVGSSHTVKAGSENNSVAGYFNDVTGDNNSVSGQSNVMIGNDSMVTGGYHNGTPLRSVVLGAGTEPKISNSIYLGVATTPSSFGGAGGVQTQISPLGGRAVAVAHPSASPLVLTTALFSNNTDTLLLNSSSMAWSFEARIIVAQTAVGVSHTNTSAVGDWAEYVVCGVAKRDSGGTTTLNKVKWLDHRNRWIPTTTPNALCFRNNSVTGARADMSLVQPSVSISSNVLTIQFVFPGFAQAMTDAGANMTPRYAEYLATGDINGGVALTINGVASTDSAFPNTVTTALAPCTVATFRNPVVDIFDGSDSSGTGYYGGVGLGATATAVTKATSVASLGYFTHGSYTIGVVATMTFDAGNATGVCVMSGVNNVHIGNNVVVVTGGTYTAANGSYALSFSGGFGAGAAGTATVVSGAITSVSITNGGTGYHSGDVITITCPAAGETVPATFTYTLYEEVTSVTIGGANNNYTSATALTTTFAGAGLTQALATAQLTPQKIDGAGTITVNTGGVGYGVRFPKVAVFDGGGTLYEDGNGGSFRASGHIIISQLKYS